MKKRIKSKAGKAVVCSGSVGTVVATKARKARVFDKLRAAESMYRIEEAVCGVLVHYVHAPNAAAAVQQVLDGESVGKLQAGDMERCEEQWNCLSGMDLGKDDYRRLMRISDNDYMDAIQSILDVRKEKS